MNLRLADMAIKAYQGILDENDSARVAFFRTLWGIQQEFSQDVDADYQVPSDHDLKAAVKLSTPVFATKGVSVDGSLFAQVIKALCAATIEQQVALPQVNDDLARIDWDNVVSNSDLELAGVNPSAYLVQVSDQLLEGGVSQVSVGMALSFVSMALRTMIEGAAEQVWNGIKAADLVETCHPQACPVCGSAPSLSHVGGETSSSGRGRKLVCTQCGTAWEYERVRCARCGTRDQSSLHFFNLEGDDSHRIATCDECGQYIRTLFSESKLLPTSYEVEDVVMARLDAVAMDPRFQGGAE
ncbi:MAG: formate dehydrogenase accessory protein FdhE [Eggerthellaceae bacterium]